MSKFSTDSKRSDAAFLGASLDQKISTIDLHTTSTPFEALETMDRELFLVSQKGERYCRVVHGIGEGILKKAVHTALEKYPLVSGWRCEEHGGSCLVLF